MSDGRVNIVGVGNTLMGDDGVGPAVIAALERRGLPGGVHLYDAGLAVSDVLSTLDPADRLIVVDCLRSAGEPGDICEAALSDIVEQRGSSGPVSLHEISVLPALRMERLIGREFRDVTIYGVEPERITWGDGLSVQVAEAVDRLAEMLAERHALASESTFGRAQGPPLLNSGRWRR